MPVVIAKSVGEKGVNQPADTAQVDAALQKIGLLPPICPLDNVRNDAIKRFQEIWGLRNKGVFDGTIDPGGGTLKKLNQTAEPLKLEPISLGNIDHGAYLVKFSPSAPPAPYQLRFGTSAAVTDSIDVTGAKTSDVMTKENLPKLLELIKRKQAWGTVLQMKLFVVLNNKVISESPAQPMNCPVQPHNGKMLPLDETNNGPKLTYQGNSDTKEFWGRMFHKIEGFDGYFFKYAGRLETDKAKRGFDCITYAGTTCGAPTNKMAASADLAAALGTTACTVTMDEEVPPPKGSPKGTAPTKKSVTVTLDAALPKYVKEFFRTNTTGYFLMYSGGHIVIVADGTVHEFSSSKGGYVTTAVQTWLEPYQEKRLTVRKLPGKPALAT